jgi:hypothetical protein
MVCRHRRTRHRCARGEASSPVTTTGNAREHLTTTTRQPATGLPPHMHCLDARSCCQHNSHLWLHMPGNAAAASWAVDSACQASRHHVLGFLRHGNCCTSPSCLRYLEATMFCTGCRLL